MIMTKIVKMVNDKQWSDESGIAPMHITFLPHLAPSRFMLLFVAIFQRANRSAVFPPSFSISRLLSGNVPPNLDLLCARACNRTYLFMPYLQGRRELFYRRSSSKVLCTRSASPRMHTPHYPGLTHTSTHTAHAARTSLCILKTYNPSPKIHFRLFSCTHHPHRSTFLFCWEVKPLLFSPFLPLINRCKSE